MTIKMFRCVAVALLLINAYSGSLGAPMPSGVYLEKNNLTELTNRCKNQFLATQIFSKAIECNTYEPKTKKEFQCYIFYDINTQLCDAIAASKLSISKEEQEKLNVDIDIDEFCQEIKNYKPNNNSTYELKAEKVFEYKNSCIKSCGTDDTTDQNTNYYCKYYKWGKDLLESSQRVTTSLAIQSIALNTTSLPQIKKVPENDVPIDPQPKGIISSITSTVHTSSTNIAKSVKPMPAVKQSEEPHSEDVKNVETEQDDKDVKNMENEQDDKDNLETNNGELNESRDDEDQLPDPMDGSNFDQIKVDKEENKNFDLREDIIVKPDVYADDDDDHFFPFFMTVVIIVVALYILYHNKNRLSKMFFGLLVEGRQSARRRNSRGHAYRRLDTLEQAMSVNTAAPPSKIIY